MKNLLFITAFFSVITITNAQDLEFLLWKGETKSVINQLELDNTKSEVYYDLATLYEEYNSNYTVALSYYRVYMKSCNGCDEKSINYVSERIKIIKEKMFMND
jgi:hypothetical protein